MNVFTFEDAVVFRTPVILVIPVSGFGITSRLRPTRRWRNSTIHASANIGIISSSNWVFKSNGRTVKWILAAVNIATQPQQLYNNDPDNQSNPRVHRKLFIDNYAPIGANMISSSNLQAALQGCPLLYHNMAVVILCNKRDGSATIGIEKQ